MIDVSNIKVHGWKAAIRGMRNPMNSWHLSDSRSVPVYKKPKNYVLYRILKKFNLVKPDHYRYVIGEKDLDLMHRLYSASLRGDNHAHRKFLRQISISMDIEAPLYWWKEFDTYKIGTTANSCSTMHKIAAKEFTDGDFSMEHLIEDNDHAAVFISSMHRTIADLNTARELYLKNKDKKWWWQMIQLLPSSYNQKRTITMNYEVAITIIKQRTNHKLDEWNKFVEILKTLPYITDIASDFPVQKGMP